jgi:cysteinyl-tRNA synthetase
MNYFLCRFVVSLLLLAAVSLPSYCGCSRKPSFLRFVDMPHTWVYWLQNPDLQAIADSGCDIAVVDYASNATDDGAYARSDLALLEGRVVLAYVSIGEAEEYRFYWKSEWTRRPPAFLGPENPEWPGNHNVRYWDEAWWNTAVAPYLDRVLEAGFDGVYLDIVDGYWFWHEQGLDVRQSADAMVALVERIAAYAEERRDGHFLVCPQNGLAILDHASPDAAERYMDTVDMVGVESLFFNVYSAEDQKERMALVRRVLGAGKPVLNVEYVKPSSLEDYYRKAARFPGLIPFAADEDQQLATLPRPCREPSR